MKKGWLLILIAAAGIFSASGQTDLKQEKVEAQTLSPLCASANKVGDRFTLLVLAPDRYKDWMVEGEVTEASADRSENKSKLSFRFDKMAHPGGKVIPIQASLLQMANSKGQVGLDDDGQSVSQQSVPDKEGSRPEPKKSGNVFSRFGKSVARGAKDLGKSIAGGMTAAFTSDSKDIRFEPGSVFTLTINSPAESTAPSGNKKIIEAPPGD